MERMEINLSMMTKDQLKKFIVELEKENKKLKEEIKERQEEVERFKSNAMADADYELKLEEENRELKEKLDAHKLYEDDLLQENKFLKEIRVIALEEENKKLKEELRHREEGDYCYDYFDED